MLTVFFEREVTLGRELLTSMHHRIARLVEMKTTGSDGTRWFEVDISPSKDVTQSRRVRLARPNRSAPRFHFRPSVLTIAFSTPTGRMPHVSPIVA